MFNIKGIKLKTANCNIKYKNRDDVLLVHFEKKRRSSGIV